MAALGRTKNPEYDELKRQTDLARRSAGVLAKIEGNTRKLTAAEEFEIPL
jgi:hypothetical protein